MMIPDRLVRLLITGSVLLMAGEQSFNYTYLYIAGFDS